MLVDFRKYNDVGKGGNENPPFLFSEKIELFLASGGVGAWDRFLNTDIVFANMKKLILTYGTVSISADDTITLQTLPFIKSGAFVGPSANCQIWPNIPMSISGPNFTSSSPGFRLEQGQPSKLNFGAVASIGDVSLRVEANMFFTALLVNPTNMYVTLSLAGYAFRS